jgi:hypothetical protein
MHLPAGKKEDISMTEAGKILFLPVPSSFQYPAREYGLSRRQEGAQHAWQHRIYRFPPRERPDAFAYSAKGNAAMVQISGTIIDLYA